MRLAGLNLDLERLRAPLPIWHGRIAREDWQDAAVAARQAGGREGVPSRGVRARLVPGVHEEDRRAARRCAAT